MWLWGCLQVGGKIQSAGDRWSCPIQKVNFFSKAWAYIPIHFLFVCGTVDGAENITHAPLLGGRQMLYYPGLSQAFIYLIIHLFIIYLFIYLFNYRQGLNKLPRLSVLQLTLWPRETSNLSSSCLSLPSTWAY